MQRDPWKRATCEGNVQCICHAWITWFINLFNKPHAARKNESEYACRGLWAAWGLWGSTVDRSQIPVVLFLYGFQLWTEITFNCDKDHQLCNWLSVEIVAWAVCLALLYQHHLLSRAKSRRSINYSCINDVDINDLLEAWVLMHFGSDLERLPRPAVLSAWATFRKFLIRSTYNHLKSPYHTYVILE